MLQGIMGNIEAEVQQVEKDRDSKFQRLQVEMEGRWDEATGLPKSTKEPTGVIEGA